MIDFEIQLENRPGALADMGEALAKAGVSIEGGGAWLAGEDCIAHFLFRDGVKTEEVLIKAGIKIINQSEVIISKLKQDQPGQLGKFTRLMQQSGVNIEVLYSDHYNQLILVVDNFIKGKEVTETWERINNTNEE